MGKTTIIDEVCRKDPSPEMPYEALAARVRRRQTGGGWTRIMIQAR